MSWSTRFFIKIGDIKLGIEPPTYMTDTNCMFWWYSATVATLKHDSGRSQRGRVVRGMGCRRKEDGVRVRIPPFPKFSSHGWEQYGAQVYTGAESEMFSKYLERKLSSFENKSWEHEFENFSTLRLRTDFSGCAAMPPGQLAASHC